MYSNCTDTKTLRAEFVQGLCPPSASRRLGAVASHTGVAEVRFQANCTLNFETVEYLPAAAGCCVLLPAAACFCLLLFVVDDLTEQKHIQHSEVAGDHMQDCYCTPHMN